jgi:hypothetical protein
MDPTPTKVGTVALVVRYIDENSPVLITALSDDAEIAVLEEALAAGEEDPLNIIHSLRKQQKDEDEKFGDYVEELLSRPFLKPEIQQHGVQWLKSKMRIEAFLRSETEATQVIAHYAFELFQQTPDQKEFYLAGPSAEVRVKIYVLHAAEENGAVGKQGAA